MYAAINIIVFMYASRQRRKKNNLESILWEKDLKDTFYHSLELQSYTAAIPPLYTYI